ncbi:hypothetical protein [Pollutimonas bauzanensis]|uniref:Uncharacterized protein n=1 Tax=Pollutimonas bauzanensis TaxID=658167 RepID=A0A1M5M0T9_9BURK|nr:hypothetical protein [Pollutimonas bauzanensis]SHG70293.1 hypothetical protein SAMN04488135_10185 [Pollutimonas bauzanensis]
MVVAIGNSVIVGRKEYIFSDRDDAIDFADCLNAGGAIGHCSTIVPPARVVDPDQGLDLADDDAPGP